MTDAIRLVRTGATAELVLDRPERRNALDEAMWRAIPPLLAEAGADPAVRVLVVRGAGGAFAAGADISEFETVYATPERAETYSLAIGAALDGLAAFAKPSIAAIEGPCVGGGCAIALACDLRFAAEGARFAITPARLGLVYPHNDTRRLIEAVGPSAAKDLLFTGRLVEAPEALALRLIDRLVPAGALDAAVAAWVADACAASRRTARATKDMIRRIQSGQAHEDDASRQIFLDAFRSEDFAEGYRAFLDKRTPRFPG